MADAITNKKTLEFLYRVSSWTNNISYEQFQVNPHQEFFFGTTRATETIINRSMKEMVSNLPPKYALSNIMQSKLSLYEGCHEITMSSM